MSRFITRAALAARQDAILTELLAVIDNGTTAASRHPIASPTSSTIDTVASPR